MQAGLTKQRREHWSRPALGGVLLLLLSTAHQGLAEPRLIVAEVVLASLAEADSQPLRVQSDDPPRRIPRRPPPATPDRSTADAEAQAPQSREGFFWRGLKVMESGSNTVGRSWVGFSREVDNFFAGDVRAIKENKSYLRLRLDTTFEEAGENESDARVKARIDLPNTKQRFRLIFDSDDDGDDTLQERVRPISTGERVRKDESVAGLELLSRFASGWEMSTSGGVRLSGGLNPYGRVKLEREFTLAEHWLANFEQQVQYYDDSGWRESTELEFIRPITEALFFNSFTEADFRDEDDQFEFVHILALNTQLNDREAVSYRTGAFGVSQPNPRTTGYFIGLNYRRRVHSDWIFLSIRPELFYPRDEGWAVEPSVNFELEVYFTER